MKDLFDAITPSLALIHNPPAVLIILLVGIALIAWLSYHWNSSITAKSGDRRVERINGGRSRGKKSRGTQPGRTKSEQRVIDVLEKVCDAKFPTAHPQWLSFESGGRRKVLELDGYNERLKLALEFSGPLHTKWYPTQEPYEKYFNRLINDQVKKKICVARGVDLIVVDMSLPREHLRNYILSRLFDLERGPQPIVYINEQIAEPFRNPQLESELGLGDLAREHLDSAPPPIPLPKQ